MTPEGKTKDRLKAFLKEWGAYYFFPVQTGLGAATVDCLVCANGRFIGIETKKKGVKTPTKRQAMTMKQIKQAKGEAYVVTLDEKDNLVWWRQ